MARHEATLIDAGYLAASLKSSAAIGAILAGLGMLASGLFGWKELPAPFAWTDVALVQFLSSLPLAALIVATIRTHFVAAFCLAGGFAALIAVGWMWRLGSSPNLMLLGAAIGLVAVSVGVQQLRPQG